MPRSAIDADLATAGRSAALSYDGIAGRTADLRVFASHAVTGGVAITGNRVEIVLAAPPGFSLVHVASDGRYYLLGGDGPGQRGELRIYATSGRLESTSRLPPTC